MNSNSINTNAPADGFNTTSPPVDLTVEQFLQYVDVIDGKN